MTGKVIYAHAGFVEIVSRHVLLRRQGVRLTGPCPFCCSEFGFGVSVGCTFSYCVACGQASSCEDFEEHVERAKARRAADGIRRHLKRYRHEMPEDQVQKHEARCMAFQARAEGR